jgi:bla regulator protein BlaR1
MIDQIFSHSIKLTIFIIVLLLVQQLFGKYLSAKSRFYMWFPILIRALIPFDLLPALPFNIISSQQLSSHIPDPAVSWTKSVLVVIYFSGMLFFAIRLIWINHGLNKRLRINRQPVKAEHIPFPVYISPLVPSACLISSCGEVAIYINPALFADKERAHHILMHEVSHAAQKDPLWNRLRAVILVIHWLNPLVWYAAACFIRDSECACDERTISIIGKEQKSSYARTLLTLILPAGVDKYQPFCQANSIQVNRQEMKIRLVMLAGGKTTSKFVTLALSIFLTLGLLLSFSASLYTKSTSPTKDAVLPPFPEPIIQMTEVWSRATP